MELAIEANMVAQSSRVELASCHGSEVRVSALGRTRLLRQARSGGSWYQGLWKKAVVLLSMAVAARIPFSRAASAFTGGPEFLFDYSGEAFTDGWGRCCINHPNVAAA